MESHCFVFSLNSIKISTKYYFLCFAFDANGNRVVDLMAPEMMTVPQTASVN